MLLKILAYQGRNNICRMSKAINKVAPFVQGDVEGRYR